MSLTVDYSKAIKITNFLDRLTDFSIDKKRTVTAKIKEIKSLFELGYDITKDLYNNGI